MSSKPAAVRHLYRRGRRLARPKTRKRWVKRRRFLSQFVNRGDLVFDVGANVGEYAETFGELGARVVAVEPKPDLIVQIRKHEPSAVVVQAAVGATVGEADLLVGGGPNASTLSSRYGEVLERTLDVKLERLRVPVTTLDDLANRFGVPDFLKLDIEGYEADAMGGMRFEPPALSFEVHGSLMEEARACLDRLRDHYEFRLAVGFEFTWRGEWGDAESIVRQLEALTPGNPLLFADVYARFASAAVSRTMNGE